MKRIILMMAITAFVTSAIAASPITTSRIEQKAKPTPEERAKSEVKMMTEHVALSADQASKIMPVALEKFREQRAIRKKNKGNQEAIKAETKKLETKYQAQIKLILSPEQYAKLKAHKAKMKARQGKGKKKP